MFPVRTTPLIAIRSRIRIVDVDSETFAATIALLLRRSDVSRDKLVEGHNATSTVAFSGNFLVVWSPTFPHKVWKPVCCRPGASP
jgi:hypothetical protein